MLGRTYQEVATINTISIYSGTGDPNGVVSATRGSLYSDDAVAGSLYRNDDGATTWTAVGGGGAASPFVATNEWFVDSGAVANAAMRIYPTIAAALANADSVLPAGEAVLIRLRDGQAHNWNGGGLPAARDVEIWCPVDNVSTLSLDNLFSVSADTYLSFKNLSIVNAGVSCAFGVLQLNLYSCSGSLMFTVIDTPTPAAAKSITISDCDSMGLKLTGADTGATDIHCSRSTILVAGLALIDNSADVAGVRWAFYCTGQSEIKVYSQFEETVLLLDHVHCEMTDTSILIDMQDSGFVTISNWTVYYGNVDISVFYYDKDPAFSEFLFGDPGYASPFQFCEYGSLTCWFTDPSGEVSGTYPLDAPIGAQAVGGIWLGIAGLDYGSYTPQWRGPNNLVRMGQRTTAAVPANSLESVLDATIYIASHFVPGVTHYLITGTITATRSGVPGTCAAFSVAILVQQNSNVFTVLAGAVPTTILNAAGYGVPTFVGVNDAGLRIDVSQAAVGGNNDWTAMLTINEQTIAV